MGVMVCDYFFIRHQKIRLSHLYRTEHSDYWFSHGLNWRVIPCWIAGWAPTIGGLIVSAGGMTAAPDALFQLYYTSFFTGFSISFTTFYTINYFIPIKGAGEFDEYDEWATFSPKEAARIGVVPNDNAEELVHTRLGASGYEHRTPGAHKDGEVDEEMPVPVEVSMTEAKTR
jgi:NCS1 family nucleobase:cation symporter-1